MPNSSRCPAWRQTHNLSSVATKDREPKQKIFNYNFFTRGMIRSYGITSQAAFGSPYPARQRTQRRSRAAGEIRKSRHSSGEKIVIAYPLLWFSVFCSDAGEVLCLRSSRVPIRIVHPLSRLSDSPSGAIAYLCNSPSTQSPALYLKMAQLIASLEMLLSLV